MPIEYLCSQASISSYLSTSFGPLSPVDHPSAQEDDACDKHCIVLTLSQGQAGLLQGRTDLSNTNVGTDQCSTPSQSQNDFCLPLGVSDLVTGFLLEFSLAYRHNISEGTQSRLYNV